MIVFSFIFISFNFCSEFGSNCILLIQNLLIASLGFCNLIKNRLIASFKVKSSETCAFIVIALSLELSHICGIT